MIAANEGNALAMAAGYYMASRTIPLVYLQNSGLGNLVNPLVSLADPLVYGLPLILLVGWRGQPGRGDWAQHIRQGAITPGLLDLMAIPYIIAQEDKKAFQSQLLPLIGRARSEKRPVAILGPQGVFSDREKTNITDDRYPLSREEAMEVILDTLPEETVYVATTGRATRELYFLRQARGEDHRHDFLNVGAMGHASSIAMGLALADAGRRVVCFDGDASALMHLGAFAMASKGLMPGFLHLVLNNGAHESVGGQPSAGQEVDLTRMAEAAGYQTLGGPLATGEELVRGVLELTAREGPAFADVRIHKGMKGDLPPLKVDHHALLADFMDALD